MQELIKVQVKDDQQLVSAKDLYKGIDYTREPESYLVMR